MTTYEPYLEALKRQNDCLEKLRKVNQQIEDQIKLSANWQVDPLVASLIKMSLELRDRFTQLQDQANKAWEFTQQDETS
jgi:hypothetical protein